MVNVGKFVKLLKAMVTPTIMEDNSIKKSEMINEDGEKNELVRKNLSAKIFHE